jgi:DNA phosphorothioation-associated putative methyltransferase
MSKQQATLGKKVGLNLYLHLSSIDGASPDLQAKVSQAAQRANLEPGKDFNVIKVNDNGNDLSLLDYPDFFEEAFPVLHRYWSFDLDQETFRFRTYKESFNPPVLHRKELLLDPKHADRKRFSDLTKEAETIGLFDDSSRIGFIQEWEALLRNQGYQVIGHELVPVGNAETFDTVAEKDLENALVQRHLTALSRTNLSAPMQTLARFGYLDGSKTIFDYGCGRGSDISFLAENNVQVAGWDPYYATHNLKQTADIVNLGFVINVIEDRQERDEALQGAFDLANEWLMISAMLEHSNTGSGKPYADGVLTSRNTFQKYFSQGELAQYIEVILGVEPLPVAPGIFYAFKDSNAEQRFSTQRVAKRRSPIRRAWKPLTPEEHAARQAQRQQQKYEANAELLDKLWERWLDLGREPKLKEIPFLEDIRSQVGSFPAALKLIQNQKGPEGMAALDAANKNRIDDLSVYFAKLRFRSRKPPRPMEPSLKEDIKHFFGTVDNALAHGEDLLLSIFDKEVINKSCELASELGLGWLIDGHSLQLHTSLVSQLSPALRTYVYCATSLYGDVVTADLIKIHIRSGKLTLMSFDDFENKPLPRMIERVKINLMNQRLDFFDYVDHFTPPFLYLKSRYINESCANFAEQLAFDEELDKLPFLDLEGYGPTPEDFVRRLITHRYQVDRFILTRSQTIPNLDQPCGENFTYRDFIECGDTQKRTGIANLPKQPETYTAFLDLAVHVLDPIIDYFGMIKLTYGFCSKDLENQISSGIAPRIDQHASHEKNRKGNYVCDRLGAAVDFLVEDEDMFEVIQWIDNNLKFDRCYYYGGSLPVHISFSKNNKGDIRRVKRPSRGKPFPIKLEDNG